MRMARSRLYQRLFFASLLFVVLLNRTKVLLTLLPDSQSLLDKPVATEDSKDTNHTNNNNNNTETKKDNTNTNNTTTTDNGFVVDVMITGSLTRPHYAVTQQRTWGSHISVRNFYIVDERDDGWNGNCTNQTSDYAYRISQKCKSRPTISQIDRHFKTSFARTQWLQKKSNPTGWMCAQTRMPYNLARIVEEYITLPDYLVVIDDDSYVNLEWLHDFTKNQNSSLPTVYAGCLVRSPIHQINWTIPFGGWGTIYSKGAIERLRQPLYCNITTTNNTLALPDKDEHFEAQVCRRLQDNLINEQSLWRPGMSVNDLMRAVVTREPNCMHSDWALAYFVNFYFVSKHTDDNNFYDDVPESRLHLLEEGELYGFRKRGGNCKNYGNLNQYFERWHVQCNPSSHICHYVTPEEMVNITRVLQERAPNLYKTASI